MLPIAFLTILFQTLLHLSCTSRPADTSTTTTLVRGRGASCGKFSPHPLRGSNPLELESTLKFGTEIEFPLAAPTQVEENLQGYREKLAEICAKCRIDSQLKSCSLRDNTLRIQVDQSELVVLLGYDPGVLEITTMPLTYRETEAWAGIIDTFIFGAAKSMGEAFLNPLEEPNRWSGHVNVSWPDLEKDMVESNRDPTIRESMILMLNFYVDLQNHPELAMGVLGGDTRNATPLAFGTPLERKSLEDIIRFTRENRYANLRFLGLALTHPSPRSFADRFKTPNRDHRYNLINTENIGSRWNKQNGSRLEIRSFFTPLRSENMLAHYRIVKGRLKYLRASSSGRTHLVTYNSNRSIRSTFVKRGLQPGINLDEAAEAYLSYLQGTGLDPLKESRYLRNPEVQKAVRKKIGRCL